MILSNYKGDMNVKSSDKGNYKSISFESFVKSPSEVIDIYKGVSSLDNIISLSSWGLGILFFWRISIPSYKIFSIFILIEVT